MQHPHALTLSPNPSPTCGRGEKPHVLLITPLSRLRERGWGRGWRILASALAFACAVVTTSHAAWPEKPLRLVVSYAPGGSTDVIARILGRALQDELGQPVVIENRPGANSIIAASAVARAPADGYTLLVSGDNTWVMNQFLYEKLPYRPFDDFGPVAKIAYGPLVLIASPKGPASFAELVTRARQTPGGLTYAYGAISPQVAGELFKSAVNADMQGIAYKGSSGVLQGLLASDVDFGVDTIAAARDYIQSGRLRLLATLGDVVLPGLPDAPVAARELGQANLNDAAFWIGISAPRATPADVIARLNEAIARAVRSETYLTAIASAGLVSDYLPPERFAQFLQEQSQLWGAVIAAAGINIQ